MKINGPGGPSQPLDIAEAGETKSAAKPDETFPAKLDAPNSTTAPQLVDPVSLVAADLKAGRVTPRQALDRMIELALDSSPAANLPDAVKAGLRAELETILREDPHLSARARRIGVSGEDG